MDKSSFLLFICFGGTLLQYAKCYSDGNFDGNTDICQTMKVDHEKVQAQISEPPFIIKPSSVSIKETNVGASITVSLSAKSADRPFMGFMLEARKRDSSEPQGKFTLVQTDISRLQTCSNVAGKAVTQTSNFKKQQVNVNWTATELGQYFFRATFIESFKVFWEIDIPPIPTSPSTAASTAPATMRTTSSSSQSSSSSSQSEPTFANTLPNSTSTFTSTSNSTNSNSNITTSTQSTPTTNAVYVQTKVESEGFLTLQFFSCLSLAETFPFLINHRMHRSVISIKALSLLSLVLSLVAFIIIVIYKVIVCSILTGLGAVLGVCQFILLFFFSGPSHELRRIFCRMFGLITFANVCFISASIFSRLLESKRLCSWLAIITGIYLACMLLLCVLHGVLHTICQTTSRQTKTVLKKQVSWWSMNCVIYTVINVSFITTLILGTFLCTQ